MNALSGMLKIFTPRRRRVSGAALVRGLAGLPAGAEQNRRGTVLVLVIGALALISVITLVYATIGQGDRRSGASSVRKANTAATVDAIADHIQRVIANGVFTTTVQSGPSVTPPILVRTAADYPFTDPYRLSVIPGGATGTNYVRRFDPTGSYDTAPTTAVDPRVQSTPFLASSEPTNFVPPTNAGTYDQFDRFHDWLHISNLAPDGRFVNLWNLAPMVGGVRESNFEAESVMNLTGSVGSPVVGELSYDLSLYNNLGQPTANLASGAPADPNIPAHWSYRQQWLFRPSAGPMFCPTAVVSGHEPNNPGDSWYAPYQYCDADGDGMFDSRWFELVDASDPNNPISLLPRDDRFRWFAAVRVVDLSGMININTATDFKEPAQSTTAAQLTKMGATPADIDLLRLLSGDDAFHQFGKGYDSLERPAILNGKDDYFGYNANNNQVGRNVGIRAYMAHRISLRQSSQNVVAPGTDLSVAPYGPVTAFTGDGRYTYFNVLGGHPSASYTLSGATPLFETSARFGMADLKELLTYWSVNNPGSLSRLEQAWGGRFDVANGGSNATDGFSPLRENRSLSLERGGNDNAENPATTPQTGLGDGLGDADALARAVFDMRHRITPFSGARPLRSAVVPVGAKNELKTSVDEKTDAVAALRKATVTTVANRDAHKLLSGYLSALAPYAMRPGSYGGIANLSSLAYGGRGEHALRWAAHMTANLIDSFDQDNVPSAYTLLINEDQKSTVDNDNIRFPWWSESLQSGRLDAVDSSIVPRPTIVPLARSGNGDTVQASLGAINVYGIEAQPFLTQAVSMLIYTDAPNAANGDDDWQSNPGPPTQPWDPITIDGSLNADNLGQVIAFQITNPFDTDIELSKKDTAPGASIADDDYSDFYLEFNGFRFKLAEVSTSGTGTGQLKALTLHAGETRVFYTFDRSDQKMADAWENVLPTTTTTLTTTHVHDFVAAQLGIEPSPTSTPQAGEVMNDGRLRPIYIKRMNASGVTEDMQTDLMQATGASKHHVLLWRTLRTATAPRPNLPADDMLCDHMRDPKLLTGGTEATLDRKLTGSNIQVSNTEAGQEPPGTPSLDNTGFTIIMWGSIRRHDDPASGTPPVGGIPAYCVEAKWSSGALTQGLENVATMTPTSLTSLDKSDFTGGGAGRTIWADTTVMGLITRLSTVSNVRPPSLQNIIFPDLIKLPSKRSGSTMPMNLDATPRGFDKLYPKILTNNKKFESPPPNPISTLRVSDLLTPMGIGPMTDPGIAVSPTDPGAQHLALSEALGLALNYSKPQASDPAWGLYADFGDPLLGVTDRGNLVLDRFAPYEENSAPVGTFNGQDQARAPGIPLALNIMNVFSVTPQDLGNLTTATPGLINANTMSPAVAQTIPLLSPTTEPMVWQNWKTLAGLAAGTTVPEPSTAPSAGDGTDIASTIIASRDKVQTLDRDGQPVLFTDGAAVSPFNPLAYDGRRLTTNIQGLRETPGWGSVGEMMTLIDRTGAGGTAGNTRIPTLNQIDFLGRDSAPSGTKGMVATLVRDTYSTPPSGTTPNQMDGIQDDWEEKLHLAAAAMGTTTVRSDTFAVWFVVHGYQKSDTENLKPEDVLVPTVAKRYLMVIDRSNVTRKGEKPRVLLFTEVPL